MTKLVWNITGSGPYEAGLDRGVYFPTSGPSEVWNGLVSVQESPSDDGHRIRYIDGLKTDSRKKPGEFFGTIEAFTYPDVFDAKVLTPDRPERFGLSYRVKTESSFKIHLVYNVLVEPMQSEYDQMELSTFKWSFSTKPELIPDHQASAHLIVDADKAYPEALEHFESILYGDEEVDSRLPSPSEVLDIFESHARLRIIDHGDGTWTAIGSDDIITMLDPTTFQIDWPSAVFIDGETYTIRSL